ncbi:hypothetical protein QG37_06479 [Candidozyma auris]|nr:hypothetical protein QG37_06479 [[Candida] auris]
MSTDFQKVREVNYWNFLTGLLSRGTSRFPQHILPRKKKEKCVDGIDYVKHYEGALFSQINLPQ